MQGYFRLCRRAVELIQRMTAQSWAGACSMGAGGGRSMVLQLGCFDRGSNREHCREPQHSFVAHLANAWAAT